MLNKWLFIRLKQYLLLCLIISLPACGNKMIVSPKIDLSSSASSLDIIIKDIIEHKEKIQNGKIVVYEFVNISGRAIPEGKLLSERLTTKLARTGEFNIIERTRLDAALKEMRLSFSGIMDEKTAIKAGEILGAQAVVTGTLARVGDKFEINVRTIDVKTGSIITGSITQINENELRMQRDPSISYKRPKPSSIIHRQSKKSPAVIKSKQLKGWEEWPGWNNKYGKYIYDGEKIYQYLVARQRDPLDFPKNGYYPSLLLAREIHGKKWTIDMKVNYTLPFGNGRWFSFYIWFGDKDIRPSLSVKNSAFILYAQRFIDQAGGGPDSDIFCLKAIYNDTQKKRVCIPTDIHFIRFERNGNIFKGLYSYDGHNYTEAFRTKTPDTIKGMTQKIVLSGQAFSSSKSVAEYEYIKFNGRKLF
jgi:TolB-like protein